MAIPTDPTADTLVTEGLTRGGLDSPTTVQKTRAKDEWLEEIKTEIWLSNTRHRLLETTSIAVTTEGLRRYSLPSDFEYDIGVSFLDGQTEDRGTAQAGATNTITLAAADTSDATRRVGKEILLTGGTGAPQIRTITAYDTATKIATVDTNWATTPSTDTTYLIVQTYTNLKRSDRHLKDYTEISDRTIPGNPATGSSVASMVFGSLVIEGRYFIYDQELYIWPVPDSNGPYGFQLTYGANLTRLDLTSTLLTKLYREWRALWVQGIKVKQFESEDDDRLANQLQIYGGMLSALSSKELVTGQVDYRDI